MSSLPTLLDALAPVIAVVRGVDHTHPDAAAELNRQLPMSSETLRSVAALVREGVSAGWLCGRESDGIRFSRVHKATGPEDVGIDAVHMNKPGPGHTHPNGEVDLCFAVDGEPQFDGRPPGWTVYPPGSWHVPTVTGGAMDILYFLPGGSIRFEPKPG